MENQINVIRKYLESNNLDAWILVDYENQNKTVVSFLGNKMLTRKIFMVFTKIGKPFLICHTIDTVFLNDKEITDIFDIKSYKTWPEMLETEKREFSSFKNICMDISADGLLPRISLADYGSVQFISSLGIQVRSSGDLLQIFSAAFDDKARDSQKEACQRALEIRHEAFAKIRELILKDGQTDEYTIQQFIAKRFHESGMVFDEEAIVAVNANASNPHYGPTEKVHSPIKMGDSVLIDMWAMLKGENTVYADITWMGYVGYEVPKVYQERFAILRKAVDSGFAFLKDNLPHRRVEGYEVDDVVRNTVNESGYGQYFTHRTGHNISVDVSPHGPGVNIDNYESHDTRGIIPNISFSLEPGIYAPDFGMRSETDVYIDEEMIPHMVGGRQDHVIAIMDENDDR
ncbi:MAG: M24 family metallopeptidase [Bacilli bacterium]